MAVYLYLKKSADEINAIRNVTNAIADVTLEVFPSIREGFCAFIQV